MNSIEPLVSVIVPVYNVEDYLCRCVDSIISQTYKHLEIILVDDGSPDNCPQICYDYSKFDSRIKVIHKDNGGLSSARNAGLDIIQGSYVTFVDSDDYIHQEMISNLVSFALENNTDIIQCAFIRGSESSFPNIRYNNKMIKYTNESIFYSKNQKIILCGKLYKSSLWHNIRMPIGKINEDDFTTWKLYYRSKNIAFTSDTYYYYFRNNNSIMSRQKENTKLDFIEAYKERILFFENEKKDLLTKLSKWRFCIPLMLTYMKGHVSKSDLKGILILFKQNIWDVIKCKKVPTLHKISFLLFLIYPNFWRSFFSK